MSRSVEDLGLERHVRVAHVIGGGDTGGAMAYLLPLLVALRTQECDAGLVCMGEGGLADEAMARGIPCEVLPMQTAWDWKVLPELRRHLARGSWDAIHTHGMRANLPVRVIVSGMRRRPGLFTTVHSDIALDYDNRLKSRAYVFLDRLSWSAVDVFFCVSAALAAVLHARGVPKARIQVVHPGIEVSCDGVTATTPTVGTVARLVAVKDIGLLLEAARLVQERVPGLRVLVVGDGPERPRLEALSRHLGLDSTVQFLGEVRPVGPLLREMQVYALTSVSEGVPLSALEAMCTGLPVVATAVGGVPEMLEDGVGGFLIPRQKDRRLTAQALADRIMTLLADAELRARMGEEARRRAVEGFSPAAAARKTLRCYQRGVAGRQEDFGT